MILTIDIGNTNINAALFENFNIVDKSYLDINEIYNNNTLKNFFNIFADNNIKDIIVSCVVDEVKNYILNELKMYFNITPVFITDENFKNMKILTEYPEKTGIDRLVNAYFAKHKYGKPIIVVDFGTATTIDIVNINGDFEGGIICPGVKTSALALDKTTSKLPLVNITQINEIIGKNTNDAILSGIVLGHSKMVEGLILKCEQTLNYPIKTVLTGGYCELISKYFDRKYDYINKDLTLEALNFIGCKNLDTVY